MNIRLKDDQGIFELDIPLLVEEITFKQYIEFRAAEQTLFQGDDPEPESDTPEPESPKNTDPGARVSENEQSLDQGDDPGQHILPESANYDRIMDDLGRMFDAVSQIVQGDLDRIPPSDTESAMDLYEDEFLYHPTNIFNTPITLVRIYVHLVNLVRLYTPKEKYDGMDNYTMKWNGSTYEIKARESGQTLLGLSYSVREAIPVLEFQKKASQIIKKKGDPDGNLSFNLGLQEMAILLRKPNVQVPINRRERIRFVDKQARRFENLPLDVVLDVRFFFIHTITEYTRIQLTNSSSREALDLTALRNANKSLNAVQSPNKYGQYSDGTVSLTLRSKRDGSKTQPKHQKKASWMQTLKSWYTS